MRKYLELFKEGFPSDMSDRTAIENWPYVGHDINGGVVYTVVPKPADPSTYVTFTAEEDNSSIGLIKLGLYQKLEYSTDTITWNTFNTTTNIPLNNGDEVYIRGIMSGNNTESRSTQFKMTGKISASGNCNALWNYEDLNAPLKARCGYRMFSGCTSLTAAPELPATALKNSCYAYMFNGCTSLTVAPELPATTLSGRCYWSMFSGCTSLTAAPELPATALKPECYHRMFFGCSSLTTAPELPATTLTEHCYSELFSGCAKLNHITCLATDISAFACTTYWVDGISSTGTFVKHSSMNDWTTGTSGVPSGWTVVDAEL